MSVGLHCDAEGCETWTKADFPAGFVVFVELDHPEVEYHFCCGWCMTKWAASMFEPTEVVDLA